MSAIESFLIHGCSRELTSQTDIVVVVQLVDGIDLSSDVVLLDLGVQVLDSGMLLITAEDKLRFLGPRTIATASA